METRTGFKPIDDAQDAVGDDKCVDRSDCDASNLHDKLTDVPFGKSGESIDGRAGEDACQNDAEATSHAVDAPDI